MSKQQININNKYDRVIALIDMDCFYCQVEERLNPELKGKPIAVVQYNAWRGGGIIAVNYPARAKGVTRHMRGDEAKEQCADIELVKVPNIREKADLSKYRDAGKEVAAVLQTFTPLLERASVDEAYLDITEKVQSRLLEMNEGNFSLKPDSLKNTYALGYNSIGDYVQAISSKISKSSDIDESMDLIPEDDRKAYKKSDIKLLIGSSIVSEIRATVKAKTGYECSAGIAHNKILAKLVCGMNKPNKQTILPLKHIRDLYSNLPVRKVQGLGGKYGEKICEDLDIVNMGELIRFTKDELQRRYDERNGLWLYNMARGIDLEAVTPRLTSKSIGCCKKFPGRNAITGMATLNHWFHELAKEICDRLEQDEIENNRKPKQMVVSFMQTINNVDVSSSRTVTISSLDEEKIVNDAIDVLKKNTDKFFKMSDNLHVLNNPIKFLGLSVGKFESQDSKQINTIQEMFKKSNETKIQPPLECDSNVEIIDHTDNSDQTVTEVNLIKSENKSIAAQLKKDNDIRKSFFANLKTAKAVPNSTTTIPEAKLESNDEVISAQPLAADADTEDEQNAFHDDMLMDEITQNEHKLNKTNPSESLQPQAEASTSTATHYKDTYAEFYRPPPLNISKVKCTQCNKMVIEHELQVHTDGHFAFQLNQEQRNEFQNQLKLTTNTSATTPPAKKQKIIINKTSTLATATNNLLSIDKFLVKKEHCVSADQNEIDPINGIEPTEKCTECSQNIHISEIISHMDYHVAKKLQKELMQSDMVVHRGSSASGTSATKQQSNGSKIIKKKKKIINNNINNNNNTGASAPSSMKSITSFFQNT